MSQHILSQSANGRAIDCTDLITGNSNFVQATGTGNEDNMICLIHKPTVPAAGQPFVDERVFLDMENTDDKPIKIRVDFNGEGTKDQWILPGKVLRFAQTVRGYSSEAVVSIYKVKGDKLIVSGGVNY